MDDQDRKKLCWECGAEVDFSAYECPFCSAQFEVSEEEVEAPSFQSSEELPLEQSTFEAHQVEDPYEPMYETSYSEEELPFGSSKSAGAEDPFKSLQDPFDSSDSHEDPSQNLYLDSGEEEDLLDLSSHEVPKQSSLFASSDEESENKASAVYKKGHIFSLCLIIPGFSLLLFGLGMLLFSENGQLTLRWDASYGLFIFTLSALFIYLGARAFRKL